MREVPGSIPGAALLFGCDKEPLFLVVIWVLVSGGCVLESSVRLISIPL